MVDLSRYRDNNFMRFREIRRHVRGILKNTLRAVLEVASERGVKLSRRELLYALVEMIITITDRAMTYAIQETSKILCVKEEEVEKKVAERLGAKNQQEKTEIKYIM